MQVFRSQSRGAIDEFPPNSKSFRQMRGERLYAKDFRGVMPPEQEIHSKFFGSHSRPMRRFARNEGVDFFLGNTVNF